MRACQRPLIRLSDTVCNFFCDQSSPRKLWPVSCQKSFNNLSWDEDPQTFIVVALFRFFCHFFFCMNAIFFLFELIWFIRQFWLKSLRKLNFYYSYDRKYLCVILWFVKKGNKMYLKACGTCNTFIFPCFPIILKFASGVNVSVVIVTVVALRWTLAK